MSTSPVKEDWVVVDVDGTLPGHLELPQDNGEFVDNGFRCPQNLLLMELLWDYVERVRPDGRNLIWGNAGIYWRLTEHRERGAVVADWMYVSGAPPHPEGEIRRSYVLWKEKVAPEIVMNFTLDDGVREHDRTPLTGKFWIYERAVQARYYLIYVVPKAEPEVYQLEDGFYRKLAPNSSGRYPIDSLGLELGVWRGRFMNIDAPWLRWYDSRGEMLLTGNERAETLREEANALRQVAKAIHEATETVIQETEAARRGEEAARQITSLERQVAQLERRRADAERQRAAVLSAKLRELGIDAESL